VLVPVPMVELISKIPLMAYTLSFIPRIPWCNLVSTFGTSNPIPSSLILKK